MSTLVCVPIMVESVEAALTDAALARDAGADLVEFRVDRFFTGGADEVERERLGAGPIGRLVAATPPACIVTCRSASEGGEYEGDEDARLALYEALGGVEGGGGWRTWISSSRPMRGRASRGDGSISSWGGATGRPRMNPARGSG